MRNDETRLPLFMQEHEKRSRVMKLDMIQPKSISRDLKSLRQNWLTAACMERLTPATREAPAYPVKTSPDTVGIPGSSLWSFPPKPRRRLLSFMAKFAICGRPMP